MPISPARFESSPELYSLKKPGGSDSILIIVAASTLTSTFVESLVGGGYIWILYGLIITLVPMALIAFIARVFLKMDFFKVCGLLSGGTTDPALLSFSEQMFGSGRIAVNYATVYPLTMFLRVVAAQILIMIML